MSFNLSAPDVSQVVNAVQKTCDTGVSGSATFTMSLTTGTATIAGPDLTVPCNGDPVALPRLPVGTPVLLHESTKPVGAAAAADVTLTITAIPTSEVRPTTVIHNAAAPTASPAPTPTPTARVLPATGGGPPADSNVPWVVIALGLLMVVGGAGLLHRRIQ